MTEHPPETPTPASARHPSPRHASVRFLFTHPAHFIALGAGSGLSPKAPGTVGTLWAWVAYLLLDPWLGPTGWGVLIGVSLFAGWWACTVTASNAGIADPGFIVWDEVVAFWLILWVIAPAGGLMQLLAFALFRYFDAAKPGPVGWADRHFKGGGWRGGFGILIDDLIAAACTLLTLAVFESVRRGWAA
jgi:phosphatidylglycerophosphatase A